MEKPTATPHVIREGYDGRSCLVHARAAYIGNGRIVAGAQPLNVAGCDSFSELQIAESFDFGATFSPFEKQEGFTGSFTEGEITFVGCDMTPLYHPATGKVVFIGSSAGYRTGTFDAQPDCNRTTYSVFDPVSRKLGDLNLLDLPLSPQFCHVSNGCGQSVCLPDGRILIPVLCRSSDYHGYGCAVLECSFDGTTLTYRNRGGILSVGPDEPRGIYEPSLILHGGRYYLTIRSDLAGYVAVSDDGLRFTGLRRWAWSDGEVLPTYNTQSHWFTLGGELWLVYTRRAGTNDHVFRHRAPLFAARVLTDSLTLERESEIVVVPERGARLGNFCAANIAPDHAFVMAAEWMQPRGCEKYGSDNAIWFSDVRYPTAEA